MKKFLTSVADAFFYDSTGNLLFLGKALLDDSIATTVGKTEIRGGKGNQLEYVYYHTAAMAIKITDTQFNLAMLAATTGGTITTGAGTDVYAEETVAFTSGVGTVIGTPITVQGGIYGWVQLPDVDSSGNTISTTNERVTFSTKTTSQLVLNPTYTGNACVRYYAENTAATAFTIPANIIPTIGRLLLDAQLVSSNSSSANVIGKAEFLIPSCQLDGAFTINMTSAGVSTTPISAIALADTSLNTGACTDVPLYCRVSEVLTSANWYDNVYALAIAGGDFSMGSATSPHTVAVYALAPGVSPFMPPVADLTFSSGTTTVATFVASVCTKVTTGSALLHVHITAAAKTGIEDSCTVTVTA